MVFNSKNNNFQLVLSILIFIISMFMCVGYAAASSVTLDILNTSVIEAPKEPFILNATLSNNIGANINQTNITYDYNTLSNLDIVLSNTNPNSSATYTITVYNPTNKDYYFDNALFSLGTDTYSNENIVFSLNGINHGNKLEAQTGKSFEITFSYKNNVLASSNVLNAIINFRFFCPNILAGDWSEIAGFKEAYTSNDFDSSIQSITFYSDGRTFNSNSYDVSEARDGSILLYKILDNNTSKYDVYIVSDDIIYFPEDSFNLFSYYDYIKYIDFNDSVDTSIVTRMTEMFTCLGENVDNFSLDVSSFYTTNVTDMYRMFASVGYNASTFSLTGLTSFNVSNVDDFWGVLGAVGAKANNTTIDVSGWDFSSANSLEHAFNSIGKNATSVTINLTNINTSTIENMSNMLSEVGVTSTTVNIIGLPALDTSSVKNMKEMFFKFGYNTKTLNLGNLGSWDTSNVENMRSMFSNSGQNADTWYVGDLSTWKTSKVTDMSKMFINCGFLGNATLNIGNIGLWDTSNVADMESMFWGLCTNAGSSNWYVGDLGLWDTGNVKNMSHMFSSLSKIIPSNLGNIGSWDTSNVLNMEGMFYGLGGSLSISPVELDLSGWNTSKVTNMSSMFWYNSNTSKIYIGSDWSTASVTSSTDMFKSDTLLPNYNSNIVDASKAKSECYGGYMTVRNESCPVSNLAQSWSVKAGIKSSIVDYDSTIGSITFHSDSSTYGSNVYDVSEDNNNAVKLYKVNNSTTGLIDIHIVSNSIMSLPTNCSFMFANFDNLSLIDFNDSVDTSQVEDMNNMFSYSGLMTNTFSITGLSNFDVSNVTDMTSMFNLAGNMASTCSLGNLSSWNTGSVTSFANMFSFACQDASTFNLGNLNNWNTSSALDMTTMFAGAGKNSTTWNIGDISNWNTANVTDMSYMFTEAADGVTSLNIGNIKNWNTSNVLDMSGMFCTFAQNVTSLNFDLSNWNTSKVTNMASMFAEMGTNSSTFTLNLSGWNTSHVTNTSSMFQSCTKLSKIYIGNNWNTGSVTNSANMFLNDSRLPNFNNSYVDKTRAVSECINGYLTVQGELCNSLYTKMKYNSVMDNIASTYVSSSSGINFANISSDTNGKGIYEQYSSRNNNYPIYYYRGNVSNNNVLFAGHCWKAIRTTSTGGIKLIYNGVKDSSNGCTNTTGDATTIGTGAYNEVINSIGDVGYMYGSRYPTEVGTIGMVGYPNKNYLYGQGFTYSNGTYTLTNTKVQGTWLTNYRTFNNYHYTCFSTSSTCSTMYYLISASIASPVYIALTDGNSESTALSQMLSNVSNTNDSTVKAQIDTWYSTNLSSYSSKIEDTQYCNDRRIYELNPWNPNGGDLTKYLYFISYERMLTSHTVALTCNNIDAFSVSSSVGNGTLTYPIALISADEVVLAGGAGNTANQSYYLYNNLYTWTMTPRSFVDYATMMVIGTNGIISDTTSVYSSDGVGMTTNYVRPVISLKYSSVISSGNGTSSSPYVIN